ncbi:MAG: hypothetical protein IKB98_02955 [Clostridia bacterium]|nr:hypothetical protein [Clostridia bacterium]
MKKILIKILACALAVLSAIGLVACGDNDWQGSNMKTPGKVLSNGGFVAETENYIYYINGFASYGDDNEFGTPVKGALMAAEKSSIKSGEVKTEVIVPKLFVAEDYSAGVYIYNGYVYYGTPSTDKNNAGEVAKGEMTFFRTKLDGSETEKYFTVTFLNYTYRFVQNNGVVYLIYYNNPESAIMCYNTSTKTEVVVAKTDDSTKGKYETLAEYTFLSGDGVDGLILLYSANIYSEDYYSGADTGDDYVRAQETFNKVYAYKAGDGIQEGNEFRGTCILDGINDEVVFTNSWVDDNLYFFSSTNLDGEETVYGVKTSDVLANKDNFMEFAIKDSNKIKNPELVGSAMFDADGNGIDINDPAYTIISGDDVTNEDGETVASSDVFIVKTSLVKDKKTNFKKVAKVGTASEMIEVVTHNGVQYAYYYNSMNCLARIKLCDVEENAFTEFYKEERISEDTVGGAWYAPERIVFDEGTANETQYYFYLDNTEAGASYIKYVKIFDKASATANSTETGIEVVAEDTDDDDKDDLFYIEGHSFIGKIIPADAAKTAVAALAKVPATLEWEIVDGVCVVDDQLVKDARNAYDALSPEAKETYGDTNVEILKGAEKAVEVLKKLYKLDGIVNYEFCDSAKQAEYRAAYNDVKAVMEEIKLDDNVLRFIENNLKWAYYEKAVDLFAD